MGWEGGLGGWVVETNELFFSELTGQSLGRSGARPSLPDGPLVAPDFCARRHPPFVLNAVAHTWYEFRIVKKAGAGNEDAIHELE